MAASKWAFIVIMALMLSVAMCSAHRVKVRNLGSAINPMAESSDDEQKLRILDEIDDGWEGHIFSESGRWTGELPGAAADSGGYGYGGGHGEGPVGGGGGGGGGGGWTSGGGYGYGHGGGSGGGGGGGGSPVSGGSSGGGYGYGHGGGSEGGGGGGGGGWTGGSQPGSGGGYGGGGYGGGSGHDGSSGGGGGGGGVGGGDGGYGYGGGWGWGGQPGLPPMGGPYYCQPSSCPISPAGSCRGFTLHFDGNVQPDAAGPPPSPVKDTSIEDDAMAPTSG